MDRRTSIVALVGTPSVGKYTVAKELARLTGARLIDNHSIANVIFQLTNADGVTPLPREVWSYVGRVRRAVLDGMIHLSPPEMSFIMTNYVRGGDEAERATFEEVAAIADIRGSVFIPVLLRCETAELVRRVASPDRRERMKLLDPGEVARLNDEVEWFETDHPNTMRLDTTSTPADETARRIAARVDALTRL